MGLRARRTRLFHCKLDNLNDLDFEGASQCRKRAPSQILRATLDPANRRRMKTGHGRQLLGG
jgi:hypothetical protein